MHTNGHVMGQRGSHHWCVKCSSLYGALLRVSGVSYKLLGTILLVGLNMPVSSFVPYLL